jgi:hypothetical protein
MPEVGRAMVHATWIAEQSSDLRGVVEGTTIVVTSARGEW